MYIYLSIYMYTYRQMQLDDFERRSVSADAPCPPHDAENCRSSEVVYNPVLVSVLMVLSMVPS